MRGHCVPFDTGLYYIDILAITETWLRILDTAACIADISPSPSSTTFGWHFVIGPFNVISRLIPYYSSFECTCFEFSDSSVQCKPP